MHKGFKLTNLEFGFNFFEAESAVTVEDTQISENFDKLRRRFDQCPDKDSYP